MTSLSSLIRLGLVAVVVFWSGMGSQAQSDGSSSTTEFRESVRQTLTQTEFQWRLPRDLDASIEEGDESRFFRDLIEDMKSWTRDLKKRFDAWSDKYLKGKSGTSPTNPSGEFGSFVGSITSWVLIAVVVGLLIWLGIMLFKNWQSRAPIEQLDDAMFGPIDLESESIVADQLPENEWTRLADEQLATGNHVLAIRALFLATLANLGERGLLRIARGKSNRDYSRELALKGRGESPELMTAFRENVGTFEYVWYGLHQIGSDAVETFRGNYNAITGATSNAAVNETKEDAS